MRADIPYQVIGGTKFYERAEIKDAIAYLTTLVNPQDAGAFTRIVNSPRRGIGSTSMSRLLALREHDRGLDLGRRRPSPSRCRAWARRRSRRCGGSWRPCTCCASAPSRTRRSRRCSRRLLQETGYLEALEAERTIEAQGRIENLEELVNVAAEYDAIAGPSRAEGSLADFLQQVALISDADERSDDEGLVTLMTLHNAKGLEYPIVFMIGLRGGGLPALARARRGRPRGGAPALLRRHHPRPARPVPDLRPHPDRVRRSQLRRSRAASSPRSRRR